MKAVRIVGIGKDLPGEPITNEELLQVCNLTDDKWTIEKALKWTEEKLGIQTRYVARDKTPEKVLFNHADPRYHNSTLCANAITKACENAHIPVTDLGENPSICSFCIKPHF
jgi:3-oxoacyl-[acyl-carrier-protein] synthase III